MPQRLESIPWDVRRGREWDVVIFGFCVNEFVRSIPISDSTICYVVRIEGCSSLLLSFGPPGFCPPWTETARCISFKGACAGLSIYLSI